MKRAAAFELGEGCSLAFMVDMENHECEVVVTMNGKESTAKTDMHGINRFAYLLTNKPDKRFGNEYEYGIGVDHLNDVNVMVTVGDNWVTLKKSDAKVLSLTIGVMTTF